MNETPQPERREMQDTNDDRAAGIDRRLELCISQIDTYIAPQDCAVARMLPIVLCVHCYIKPVFNAGYASCVTSNKSLKYQLDFF
jgi:hypothetical protein